MENALTRSMIRQRRIEAQRKVNEGREELAACDAADRLLDSFGVPKDDAPLFSQAERQEIVDKAKRHFGSSNPYRVGSIKAAIWQALYESPDDWVDANWVQEAASAIKGEVIPMASISPNLSNMKGEHIVRDGLKVALKLRLNENGEAEASPDADEVTASSVQ